MNKILFVCYGGGHLQLLIPIMKELEKKNQDFAILALTAAYQKCKKLFPEQTRCLLSYIVLFDNCFGDVKKLGNQLLVDNYNPNSGIDLKESIMYLGLSMFDLINQYGKTEAFRRYTAKGRHCFLPVASMKKILNFEQPDLLVSTTSPRFELASIYAANEIGIKTLQILDLFGDVTPLPSAQYIVCMNNAVKEVLTKRGLKESQVFPFGQPAIEETVKNIEKIDRVKLRKKYIKGKTKVLLFASQRPLEYDGNGKFNGYLDYHSVNINLCRVFKNIENEFNVKVIIRIHPNESIENYEILTNTFECINLNLYETISLADIVVTSASTVAIEAIASCKKVFTFSYDEQKNYPIETFKEKPFIFSNGYESLELELKRYLTGLFKENKKDIDVLRFIHRNSSVRIANLIRKLVA